MKNGGIIKLKFTLLDKVDMGKDRNFYYYEVFIKSENNDDLNPIEVINAVPKLFDSFESIATNVGESLNEFTIIKLADGFYGGRILRSNAIDGYYGKHKKQIFDLKEHTDKVDRVGRKLHDIVHFIIKPTKTRVYFVVEVGLQAIGMPKITEVFQNTLTNNGQEVKLKYEAITKGRKEFNFSEIENKPLKKITMKFRKNFENLPDGVKYIEDAEKEFVPQDFRLKIEISVARVSKKALEGLPIVGKYISNIFCGGDPKNLNKIDYTSFLEDFRVAYADEADGKTKTQDILDKYLRVKLEIEARLEPERVYGKLIDDFKTHSEVNQ